MRRASEEKKPRATPSTVRDGRGKVRFKHVKVKQAGENEMKPEDARELREELEAIEATMVRIKELWLSNDFPTADELEDLCRAVNHIDTQMDCIIEKAKELPTADELAS